MAFPAGPSIGDRHVEWGVDYVFDGVRWIGAGGSSLIADPSAGVSQVLQIGGPADAGLTIRGAVGQSGAPLRIQDDSGTNLMSVDAAGGVIAGSIHIDSEMPSLVVTRQLINDDLANWQAGVTVSGALLIEPMDDGLVGLGTGIGLTRNAAGVTSIDLETVNGLASVDYAGAADLPSDDSIVTRVRGDARYAPIASSLRYKDLAPRSLSTNKLLSLLPYAWVWGGALPANDPRRGKRGFGLVAEDVERVLPEAIVRNEAGEVEGLDPLTLIGALFLLINGRDLP